MTPPRLIVFAKAPVPGLVKTRLTPPLTATQAAEFAEAALLDTLASAVRVSGARVDLAYAPPESGPEMFAWLDRRVALGAVVVRPELWPQEGENLGRRMCAALRTAFADGAGKAVIVGSDAPDLPAEALTQVLAVLDGPADAVLGPCPDGGYYLLGTSRPPALELLDGVEWSSGGEAAATRERLARAGFRLSETAVWPDIDTPADLAALAARLATRPANAPRTAAWLATAGLSEILRP